VPEAGALTRERVWVRAPARETLTWARRHPTVTAAVVYAVLSLVLFSQALAPGHTLSASNYLWFTSPWNADARPHVPAPGSNPDEADSVVLFQPMLQTTRASLTHIPLWNPYIMGGRPYVADAQSAVFSVFSLPAYVLPFWRSLALIAALKLFVAAFGAYLLARGLGMRFAGALLAGVVFGFSLWMVAWVTWPTASVWAFLPWLCLLTERLVRDPGPLPGVGLVIVVALQYFAGHPESSFDVLVFTALFWVFRMVVHRPRTARAIGRRALLFGSALVAGTALAAALLIPFLELVSHSTDISVRSPLEVPGRYLFGIFLHDYWGRQTATTLASAHALEERAYYVGALTLILGAAALLLRPRRERVVLAILGVVAMAVAVNAPVFNIVTRLPGFSTAQNNRLAVITVLCSALLAGWGLDDLVSGPARTRARQRALMAIGVALLVFPILVMAVGGTLSVGSLGTALHVAWGFGRPQSSVFLSDAGVAHLVHVVRLASLLEWVVPAAVAVALVGMRLRGLVRPHAFAVAALGLVVVDLFRAGMGYNPAIPIRHAVQPVTPAIRYLQSQRPARFVGIGSLGLASLVAPMPPDVAMRYGLYDARGYDYPVVSRYEQLWRRNIATSAGCYYAFCPQSVSLRPAALHALGLFGVSDILEARRDAPLRFRVAYAGADARIYSNPYALPRALLVDRQVVVRSAAGELATVSSTSFPSGSVAVTSEPLPGLQSGPGPPLLAARASIVTYRPEQVTIETRAPRSALLVLTDTYFPGWSATVDGRRTAVHRVDYLLRGITVPAGTHTVEFRYQPASWRVGWIISGITMLALVATAWLGWRRAHRPGRP
jgi:Bacterial membrane protein YfhO